MDAFKGRSRANIVVVHKDVADDFAKFGDNNYGCLPIFHRTKPGDRSLELSSTPELQCGISPYRTYRNGKEEIMGSVTEEELKDMVTFYIGCSFSFDELFAKYKLPFRHLEQNCRISVHMANFSCYTVGIFKCQMVLSMRPVPEDQLSLVADITSHLFDAHGAPIYIGNPDVIIGPQDEYENDHDFCDVVKVPDGDVPVFWACGIAMFETLKNSNLPLAIAQSPGWMDPSFQPPREEYHLNKPDAEKCQVVKYSDKGQRYSILSVKSVKILTELEKAVMDPQVSKDFMQSSLALSHASSVAIISGNNETDGMSGFYSLAAMLQAADKDVTLIVGENDLEINVRIMKKQVEAGILRKDISVITGSTLTNNNVKSNYDVVLTTGRNEKDTKLLDDLLDEAAKRKGAIAIGATAMACYGYAIALYELRSCKIHDRYYRQASGAETNAKKQLGWALPTAERVSKTSEIIESCGKIKNAMNGIQSDLTRSDKINQMRKIISV